MISTQIRATLNATKLTTPTQMIAASGLVYNLLGCFKLPNPSSSLSAELLAGRDAKKAEDHAASAVSLQSCVDYCSSCDSRNVESWSRKKDARCGYRFVGLVNGRTCNCGTSLFVTALPTDRSLCNISCTGDISTACGGIGYMTIYELYSLTPADFLSSTTTDRRSSVIPAANTANVINATSTDTESDEGSSSLQAQTSTTAGLTDTPGWIRIQAAGVTASLSDVSSASTLSSQSLSSSTIYATSTASPVSGPQPTSNMVTTSSQNPRSTTSVSVEMDIQDTNTSEIAASTSDSTGSIITDTAMTLSQDASYTASVISTSEANQSVSLVAATGSTSPQTMGIGSNVMDGTTTRDVISATIVTDNMSTQLASSTTEAVAPTSMPGSASTLGVSSTQRSKVPLSSIVTEPQSTSNPQSSSLGHDSSITQSPSVSNPPSTSSDGVSFTTTSFGSSPSAGSAIVVGDGGSTVVSRGLVAIIAGSISGVVAICVVCVILWCYRGRKRQSQQHREQDLDGNSSASNRASAGSDMLKDVDTIALQPPLAVPERSENIQGHSHAREQLSPSPSEEQLVQTGESHATDGISEYDLQQMKQEERLGLNWKILYHSGKIDANGRFSVRTPGTLPAAARQRTSDVESVAWGLNWRRSVNPAGPSQATESGGQGGVFPPQLTVTPSVVDEDASAGGLGVKANEEKLRNVIEQPESDPRVATSTTRPPLSCWGRDSLVSMSSSLDVSLARYSKGEGGETGSERSVSPISVYEKDWTAASEARHGP